MNPPYGHYPDSAMTIQTQMRVVPENERKTEAPSIQVSKKESKDRAGAIIVSWDDEDDISNPKNWSAKKKMLNVGIVSLIGFLTPLSSSISSPGAAKIMAEFHSDSNVLAGFVTSIYVLGNAVGPVLFAPASELWGRLVLFHVCNVAFVAFTLACALSTSLPMLIVFRFLAGCAGAGPLAIGGGTIGDMIPVEQRGKYTAIFAAGSLVGPIVGPIAGGYLTMSIDWRWSFWIVVLAGGAVTVAAFACLRETHAATILKRKAARLQKHNPDIVYQAAGAVTESSVTLFKRSFVRPMKMLLRSPIVFILAIFQALCFGYMYLLFTTFPMVFGDQYGFNAGASGLAFLGFGFGSVVGLAVILSQSDKMVKLQADESPTGKAEPEIRLIFMKFGVPCLPIGLFWYGWAAEAQTHWIVPIMGTFVLALGVMSVSLPGNLYMIDCYTIYAASALAAMTLLRSILGGLLPLAGGPMYAKLGIGWGNSLLGFIALPFCFTPPILVAYGERIRNRFPINL